MEKDINSQKITKKYANTQKFNKKKLKTLQRITKK
jgi:hypothetical protein